jgi:hypothetical protein
LGAYAKRRLSEDTDLGMGLETAHRFDADTCGVTGNVVDLWSFSLPGRQMRRSWLSGSVDVDHRVSPTAALTFGVRTSASGGDGSWALNVGLRMRF